MTDKEIILNILNKAEQNGFKGDYIFHECLAYIESKKEFHDGLGCVWHINRLIFNHDFAKAFWGETTKLKMNLSHPLNDTFGKLEFHMSWKYHLQQMVIYENPLKYLEKFL